METGLKIEEIYAKKRFWPHSVIIFIIIFFNNNIVNIIKV